MDDRRLLPSLGKVLSKGDMTSGSARVVVTEVSGPSPTHARPFSLCRRASNLMRTSSIFVGTTWSDASEAELSWVLLCMGIGGELTWDSSCNFKFMSFWCELDGWREANELLVISGDLCIDVEAS